MKIEIIYRINALSGILAGATAEVLSVGVDRTTARRRVVGKKWRQEPLLPGSSVKGKLRHECERILTRLGQKVCLAPRADLMCPNAERVPEQPCPACRLFGHPGRQVDDASRLFFSDAIADLDGSAARFATRAQAGVSLSRRRRTAEDQRLYTIERGVEGLSYKGTISGYLRDETARRQAALLIAALGSLVAVGGGKSRGAGWTKVEVTSVTLDGESLSAPQLEDLRREVSQWRV